MDLSFLDAEGLGKLPELAISLGIGLLIGLERERNPSAKAGLRTCGLTALFGALAAALGEATGSPWILAAGLVATAAMIVAAYLDDDTEGSDPGTTTVIAVLLAYSLGALAYLDGGALAAILAIVVTALLHFKPELAGFAARFDRDDLLAVLQFGVLSVVVLPLLPDRGFGPYAVLNPYKIWLMVVLISGLSLAGYIALRFVGGKRSVVLLGIFGGMVSTTATTMLYSRQAREKHGVPLATRVILVANLVLLVRLGVLSAIIVPAFFVRWGLPVFGVALMVGIVLTWFASRGLGRQDDLPQPATKNPAELKAALSFGLLFGVILLLSAWLRDIAGDKGVYAVALISGVTDTDAITLSMLDLLRGGSMAPATAMTAIVIALAANQAGKLGFVASVGGSALFRKCVLPMAATPAAAAITTAVLALGST